MKRSAASPNARALALRLVRRSRALAAAGAVLLFGADDSWGALAAFGMSGTAPTQDRGSASDGYGKLLHAVSLALPDGGKQ